MLKRGQNCIQGYRTALVVIQLFRAVCWLIPIALELFLRRILPLTVPWESGLLVGSYLLNRILLAPANTGYYACCRRLASITNAIAATSEIEDLREEMTAPTLLACFFLDYRHPIKSVKWQLRYDAFRFVGFVTFTFPAIVFVAVGARGESPLLQAVCLGGAILCGVVGVFLYYLLLLRLRPMLYRRPQYGSFYGQMHKALQLSRKRLSELLCIRVKYIAFTPLLSLPFLCFRAAMLTQEASLLSKPQKHAVKRKKRVFHTRVLRDA